MHPVILLILLVAVLVFVSWYKRAPATQQKKAMTRALIFGGGALLLLALATGRLNPLVAALAAAVPVLYRVVGLLQTASVFKGFANQFKSARGPTPGKTSGVETRFVRMTLDHDTGAMDGEVVEGAYAGRRLASLSLGEALDLLATCRAEDSQSAAVLEAWLDRAHPDWRDDGGAGGAGAGARGGSVAGAGTMSPHEAREVLGVGADATREEIVEAHRRLIQKLHPDRGGSTYLAAKLNDAKQVLLGG